MTTLRLVVVSRDGDDWAYHAYTGKVRTHKYRYHAPLPPEWVEEIRSDPVQFEAQEPGPQEAA